MEVSSIVSNDDPIEEKDIKGANDHLGDGFSTLVVDPGFQVLDQRLDDARQVMACQKDFISSFADFTLSYGQQLERLCESGSGFLSLFSMYILSLGCFLFFFSFFFLFFSKS